MEGDLLDQSIVTRGYDDDVIGMTAEFAEDIKAGLGIYGDAANRLVGLIANKNMRVSPADECGRQLHTLIGENSAKPAHEGAQQCLRLELARRPGRRDLIG